MATKPIFSLVNIIIVLKICSCLWMISLLKRFSTDIECSEMYICTIWSDVQFPVDPLTAEGRLRHNNMDVCLFVRRCSNRWINKMPCIAHVWYHELGDHWSSNGLRLIIIGVEVEPDLYHCYCFMFAIITPSKITTLTILF